MVQGSRLVLIRRSIMQYCKSVLIMILISVHVEMEKKCFCLYLRTLSSLWTQHSFSIYSHISWYVPCPLWLFPPERNSEKISVPHRWLANGKHFVLTQEAVASVWKVITESSLGRNTFLSSCCCHRITLKLSISRKKKEKRTEQILFYVNIISCSCNHLRPVDLFLSHSL